MAKIYLAVNGDQVGGKISEAIQSNDPEQVRQMSASFNQAHAEIDQWVEKNGGRVISASGDEAIYEIEDSKVSEMERLMSNYESSTGHTLTIGAGSNMLEAVKAMVYGKMHDAGQIIQYDEEVENAITPNQEAEAEEIAGETEEGEELDQDEDSEMDESQEIKEEDLDDSEGEELEDEELEDEEQEESEEMVEMPRDEFVEEHENLVDTLRSPDHEDDLEEADEQEQELEEYSDEEESEDDDQMVDMSEDEQLDPEQLEMADEDQEDMESDEGFEPEMSEEDDMEDQDPEMSEEGDMEDQDPEMSEEGDMEEELAEDEQPSPISDMVHANSEMDPEMSEEEPQEGSQELKQRVMDTLMSFKANKEKIQMLQQADPEMYQNVIDMLNSMISMAKELQVSPEKEIAAQEGMDEIPELEEQEIKKPMGGM